MESGNHGTLTEPIWIIAGPTCSGKSMCGRFLQQHGFKWLESSTPMVSRVPLEQPQEQRLQNVESFFAKEGKDFTARWVINILRESRNNEAGMFERVVITGCRFVEEVSLLKSHFRASVIALYTPLQLRYDWALSRKRIDVSSLEDFVRHSFWEHSLGLSRILFEADYLLLNSGTEAELYRDLLNIITGTAPDA